MVAAIFKTSAEPACAKSALAQKKFGPLFSSESASLQAVMFLKITCNFG